MLLEKMGNLLTFYSYPSGWIRLVYIKYKLCESKGHL
jgi:hypothetical protein